MMLHLKKLSKHIEHYHYDVTLTKTKMIKNGQKFKEITEAYQFLRLEQKKQHKNPKDAELAHVKFWKYYDKQMNQGFRFYK